MDGAALAAGCGGLWVAVLLLLLLRAFCICGRPWPREQAQRREVAIHLQEDALVERLERTATLCVGLVAAPFCPPLLGHDLMWWVLYFVAFMTHLTGAQRMARRLRELGKLDAED